jgi:hypothetical protein
MEFNQRCIWIFKIFGTFVTFKQIEFYSLFNLLHDEEVVHIFVKMREMIEGEVDSSHALSRPNNDCSIERRNIFSRSMILQKI